MAYYTSPVQFNILRSLSPEPRQAQGVAWLTAVTDSAALGAGTISILLRPYIGLLNKKPSTYELDIKVLR